MGGLDAHFLEDAELAHGVLGHGHVEYDVFAIFARDRDDEGVVAEFFLLTAPRGDEGPGVGPADADAVGVGGLPAVVAGAHPVVGAGEGDAAEAVGAGEFDGAVHGDPGVPGAGAEVAVPAFEDAEALDEGGFDVGGDVAFADGIDDGGEAVEAVGGDAVAGGVGEELGAAGGAFVVHAGGAKDRGELCDDVGA